MKAVAIDDEPLALSVIEHFCKNMPSVDLVRTFTDSVDGLQFIENYDVDVVFLDINIPHLDGMELARRLPEKVKVIFTTAYQNFAIEGFEVRAVDYLLKPISFDRFKRAVAQAEKIINLERFSVNPDPCISVKINYVTTNIPVKEIIYVEGLKDYVRIFTENKSFVTKQTMKSIAEMLCPSGFIRIHRSFTANLNKIVSFGNNYVQMQGGKKIPVGNQYKAEFLDAMQNMTLQTKL